MNNQCDRLNLLDFNKWNCLILLCGAIIIIIIIIIIIMIFFNDSDNFINQFLKMHYNMSKKCVKSSLCYKI